MEWDVSGARPGGIHVLRAKLSDGHKMSPVTPEGGNSSMDNSRSLVLSALLLAKKSRSPRVQACFIFLLKWGSLASLAAWLGACGACALKLPNAKGRFLHAWSAVGDEALAPGHVVCNVGHLPTCDQDDLRATVHASLQIMEELARGGGAEGFAARPIALEARALRGVQPALRAAKGHPEVGAPNLDGSIKEALALAAKLALGEGSEPLRRVV